jgi:hypothetical protein
VDQPFSVAFSADADVSLPQVDIFEFQVTNFGYPRCCREEHFEQRDVAHEKTVLFRIGGGFADLHVIEVAKQPFEDGEGDGARQATRFADTDVHVAKRTADKFPLVFKVAEEGLECRNLALDTLRYECREEVLNEIAQGGFIDHGEVVPHAPRIQVLRKLMEVDLVGLQSTWAQILFVAAVEDAGRVHREENCYELAPFHLGSISP